MKVILLRTQDMRTVLCAYIVNDDITISPEVLDLALKDGCDIRTIPAHYLTSQQDLADEISFQCAPMSDP